MLLTLFSTGNALGFIECSSSSNVFTYIKKVKKKTNNFLLSLR